MVLGEVLILLKDGSGFHSNLHGVCMNKVIPPAEHPPRVMLFSHPITDGFRDA
jgi:hypothetical protein